MALEVAACLVLEAARSATDIAAGPELAEYAPPRRAGERSRPGAMLCRVLYCLPDPYLELPTGSSSALASSGDYRHYCAATRTLVARLDPTRLAGPAGYRDRWL